MVVPVNAPVKLAAVSAENHLCKTVIAGETALLACRADVDYPATDKLRLHLHEELLRNDHFMVALDVVLRNGAVVLDPLFCQEVRGYSFLEQGVAHVFLVSQDLVDGGVVPFCLARAGEDAVLLQSLGDLLHGETFEVLAVDSLDDLRLFRVDGKVPVAVLGVSEEVIVVDLYLSLLVAVL